MKRVRTHLLFIPGVAARTCAKSSGVMTFLLRLYRFSLLHAGVMDVNTQGVGSIVATSGAYLYQRKGHNVGVCRARNLP